jgi:hypothetical protein
MRFLKIALSLVIVAVAVFAGVFVLAGVLIVGALYFLIQRLRGKPTFIRFGLPPRPPVRPSTAARGAGSGDIIDVTATEVAPPARQLPPG